MTDLQEQIAALTARLNGGELDRLVGAALQDGRLLPSWSSGHATWAVRTSASSRRTWTRPRRLPR
ncbi:hypothetical protein P4056_21950 [Pseudomonas aeruginosa]|nr:hypothetical protein [Pseudomonas aeruginosa]